MTHQVANTILAQLGGNRFLAMTGAYSLTGSADALSMRIPQKRGGVFGVRVTLDADDTYTLVALKSAGSITKGDFHTVESYKESGLYHDMLQAAFTEATGLAVSL